MIKVILVALGLGGLLGLALGIASKAFAIKEDERVKKVTELLPGFNCGGCGFAGCAGMAEALVNGKVKNINGCRASRPAVKQAVINYLATTPGADGKTIKIEEN